MAAPADADVDRWLPEDTVHTFEESRVAKALKTVNDLDQTRRNEEKLHHMTSEEFQLLGSERFIEEGKTYISDQNLERTELARVKHEKLVQ